jgi:hypothetical protein
MAGAADGRVGDQLLQEDPVPGVGCHCLYVEEALGQDILHVFNRFIGPQWVYKGTTLVQQGSDLVISEWKMSYTALKSISSQNTGWILTKF